MRNRRLMRALRRIALIVAAGAAMSAPLAAAAAAPDLSGPPVVEAVIPVLNVGDPDGPDGSGSGDFTFPTAAGDVNNFDMARRGD